MNGTNDALGRITALLAEYAACIDNDALESWPGFFTPDCRYTVTTAYNHAQGYPIGIIDAHNRMMLEDRVAALRQANIYEAQHYRHIISVVRIMGSQSGTVAAEASFLVVRITAQGMQDLFATGRYLLSVDMTGETPLIKENIVVLDSDKIDTLLAIPL